MPRSPRTKATAVPDTAGRRVPPLPRALGAAGLLPQAAAALAVATGRPDWLGAAQLLAGVYGGLILSFLGGLWWGLAAAAPAPPRWLWIAAFAPSLWCLAALAAGLVWSLPGLTLLLLAAAILLTPLVDHRLTGLQIAPPWWMRLRLPLSAGLGLLTLLVALIGGPLR